MMNLILVCSGVFLLLIITELLWKKKLVSIEASRKLIHIIAGTVVAFMPYFASWSEIQILSLAFLVVVFLSARFNVLKSIHSVKRVTHGEVLYALAIVICAFLQPATWIFMAAILHLALADAFAALVGVKWGKTTGYKIITHGKSLVGSLAFFVTSALIFASLMIFGGNLDLPAWQYMLIIFPLVLTLLENISWYGSDNITIPVAVYLLLSGL